MSSKTKTAAAKADGKPGLVPKLRFPEFRGAEGWVEKPLKEAARINPAHNGLPDSFVYIDLESVDAGELKTHSRIAQIGAPSRAQRLLERGDIIYQVVRPYQRNNLICEFDDDEDYVASTGYAQLRAKGSNHFLYQSIHTDSFVGRVIAKCTGSNYPAINSSDLAEIELALPTSLSEQQKIAECLSSVDALITAQARKLDALKTHKKGLMQRLFPREGETQPRLRFPEFREEWAKTQLEALCVSISSGKDHSEPDGAYALYGSTGIIGKTATPTYKTQRLLVARVGANAGLLTMADGQFGVTDNTLVVSPNLSTNLTYVFYYLGNININRLIFGSGQPLITGSILKALPIFLPEESEQAKISDCLSTLDEAIYAQGNKLEALKIHKKGLMQQLFPSPKETQT
jgi:type I restriction enzyme S subunit